MKRALPSLLLLLGLWPSAAGADTVLSGFRAQAYYRIVVPDEWNGSLVIWNHGLSLNPIGPVSDLGPLSTLQLAEGYAVAASSYRMNGWALFKTNQDLEALYQTFVDNFGPPAEVIVTGASLGGIVTAAALEGADIGNVTGAYTLCGAMAGSRLWDGALDLRLGYDVLCSSVLGAAIPGGAEGLPAGSSLNATQIAQRVHACFGVLVPEEQRTDPQKQRLATFLAFANVPESFVVTDMVLATLGMANLVHDRRKLRGRVGTGNRRVSYGDPFDAAIARVSPHPLAAPLLRGHYRPQGHVGAARIVSLHTDKDGLVVVENQSEYASVVPAESLTVAVAVEDVPSHCAFGSSEVVAGWEALRAWLAGGAQPTAADIQATCLAVQPTYGGACRIDPSFVIPDLDTRIRPR